MYNPLGYFLIQLRFFYILDIIDVFIDIYIAYIGICCIMSLATIFQHFVQAKIHLGLKLCLFR